ncbi:MAG: photosynthetic complex assembly protein PuhC [Pseudomonadota bacterium]
MSTQAIEKPIRKDDFKIHTVPMMAMGILISASLGLAVFTSLGIFDRQGVPEDIRAQDNVMALDTRSIMFNDAADGSVWVSDAVTGEELARFAQGEGGFVRSTARAMVTGRQQHGLGPEVPFELIKWDNEAMTLRDTQTGRSVELAAFGSKTHEVYKDILVKGRK